MSAETDYLPVATAGGANVVSQGAFVGAGWQTDGFTAGLAVSAQANKVWRQATMFSAALANVISIALGGINVIDDGNLSALIGLIQQTLYAAASKIVTVAYSATPVFDASTGNVFQIVLTGNVTSSTLVNLQPGMQLTFLIQQDGTGSRTFVPPAALPLATIDPTAGITNSQSFVVAANGTSIYPTSPLLLT